MGDTCNILLLSRILHQKFATQAFAGPFIIGVPLIAVWKMPEAPAGAGAHWGRILVGYTRATSGFLDCKTRAGSLEKLDVLLGSSASSRKREAGLVAVSLSQAGEAE